MPPSRVLAAVLATALAGVGVLAAAALPSPWGAWRPATCMPAACFCEQLRPALVRQPANAVSSLAFVLVALLVLAGARPAGPARNPLVERRVYAALYAGATLLVGAGSAFYHASLTFWGQTADVLGMYLVATFLLLYGAARLRPLPPARAAWLYLGGNAVLLALLVAAPGLRRWVFALLVLAAGALELRLRRRGAVRASAVRLHAALGVLALGAAVWALDLSRAACAPASPLQGHALWHLCGAFAAGMIYLYYRSEDRRPPAAAPGLPPPAC